MHGGLIPRVCGVPPALPLGRLPCPLFGRQRLLSLRRGSGLARGTRLAFPGGGGGAGRGDGREAGGGVEVVVVVEGVGREGFWENGGGCHQPAGPGRGVGARASVSCPRRRKSSSKLGREWVARRTPGGRQADARPFGSARWAAFCVHADPNGRQRTKWVAPLELLLVPLGDCQTGP